MLKEFTTPKTSGRDIKNNIQKVLSKKYGVLNTRNLFDNIPDKDIEDNLETAENTIQTNIDRGALNKSLLPKLPNLRDGLSLSFAAAGAGNSKAATKAREAVYTEEPLVKDTGIKLYSGDISSVTDLPKATDKIQSFVEEPKEKTSTTKVPDSGKNFDWEDVIKKTSNRATPQNSDGVRFKAMTQKQTGQGKTEKQIDNYEKESSKLDKYEITDAVKDWLLPPNDAFDVVKNIKNKDYLSAIADITRNMHPIGDTTKDFARSVWKAGSELYLRPKGWNISADMLEHSLQEKPKDVVFYDDSDVVKKIKKDENFIKHLDDVIYKMENNIPLEKDKDKSHNFGSDDLFYSIHRCEMDVDDIKYNSDGTKDISVHLHDTYDYTKIWTSMDGDKFNPLKINLGSVANDGGTISSKLDAINPYEVDIYFTIRR